MLQLWADILPRYFNSNPCIRRHNGKQCSKKTTTGNFWRKARRGRSSHWPCEKSRARSTAHSRSEMVSACGQEVEEFHNFCPNCGTNNPHFNANTFKDYFDGETLEEAIQTDCRGPEGHDEQLTNFCPLCGHALFPQGSNEEKPPTERLQ